MKICIPSKDRAETMTTHLFFNPRDILIFVEPHEIKKYKIFHPEYEFVNIEHSNKGVSYARNYILNYVNDTRIIMADDDYESFGKRNNDYRYSILHNCQEIVNSIENNLTKYIGCGICNGAFSFFSNKTSNNQRLYINKQALVDFYGLNIDWLKKKNIKYDEKLKEGEDSDLSIMIVLNDGKICNDYLYSRRKKFQNSGGLSAQRNGILTAEQAGRSYMQHLTKKYGAEFINIQHNSKGYLSSCSVKFNLITKRPEIVKENIKKFKNEK